MAAARTPITILRQYRIVTPPSYCIFWAETTPIALQPNDYVDSAAQRALPFHVLPGDRSAATHAEGFGVGGSTRNRA
jgi:hypothetical protein